MKGKKYSVLAGIDEAGRGPIAGPLSLGIVVFSRKHKLSLKGLRDSKKLSPKIRELWFEKIQQWSNEGKLNFAHCFIHSRMIDKKGLAWALSYAVEKVVNEAKISPKKVEILLDAGLKAPRQFSQRSIVKGDEKIPIIALASIVAKVLRDRHMVQISKRYPKYKFDVHKGYGTSSHKAAIRQYGLSPIHRRSFLIK